MIKIVVIAIKIVEILIKQYNMSKSHAQFMCIISKK